MSREINLFTNNQSAGLEGWAAVAQSTAGFAGANEVSDHFGASVALRPNRDSSSLLAIGIPDEDLGLTADAGMVQTVTVRPALKLLQPQESYTENAPGTPGRIGSGHRFGLVVAATEGRAESVLAMSSPYSGDGLVFLLNDQELFRSWVPGADDVPRLVGGRFGWSVAGLNSS